MARGDLARLGLGTVQFGLDYGISNRGGQTPMAEVKRILACAMEAGMGVLDTAALYGESEAVLGTCLPVGAPLRVVTKTPAFPGETIGAEETALLVATLERSLHRLGLEQVDGLLVHHGGDLLKPGGARLWEAMQELQAAGKVGRIGASVYGEGESLRQGFPLERVQLPLNLFDQRPAASGLLSRLEEGRCEVHVRSVFLQGLLLMTPGEVPPHFSPLAEQFHRLDALCADYGVTRLGAALWYALRRREVGTVLVGVTSLRELEEILSVVEGLPEQGPEAARWETLAVNDPAWVDPSRWPRAG